MAIFLEASFRITARASLHESLERQDLEAGVHLNRVKLFNSDIKDSTSTNVAIVRRDLCLLHWNLLKHHFG